MRFRFLAPLSATSIAESDVAPATSSAAACLNVTLRAKGILSFVALVVYVAAIALYVAHDRQKLLHIVQQLDHVHSRQNSLVKVNTAVAHSIVELQFLLNTGNITPVYDDIELDFGAIKGGLPELKERYPEIVANIIRFETDAAELSTGRSREKLIALRDSEQELNARLENIESMVQQRGEMLSEDYRAINHNTTQVVVIMGFLGVVIFGAAVTVFFTKLAADIKKLESRAVAIVGGYRGTPLDVTRHDELGGLMGATNRMQSELLHGERQREISGQRRFHQEKMAAVGSLAATVAHEISNPINSISGIAQHTMDAIRSGQRSDDETLCGNAELTLKQTERIASIVRQLADLSAPRSPDPELLHINELVRTTCSFIRYDKRFRHIDLVTDSDHDLPAVRAVADHLTQVLMNLLINAADAMEGVADRKPTIRVSTRQADGEIILSVSDNGNGIDPGVLTHAFEQSFTTKPAGKGRGIGLYLCKTLIEEIGGRIELESTPDAGTTARVRLPCSVPGRALA